MKGARKYESVICSSVALPLPSFLTFYFRVRAFSTGLFPSSHGPLYQNEVTRLAFDMETILIFHASKTHFHRKGCALGHLLKVRVFGNSEVAYFPTITDGLEQT